MKQALGSEGGGGEAMTDQSLTQAAEVASLLVQSMKRRG